MYTIYICTWLIGVHTSHSLRYAIICHQMCWTGWLVIYIHTLEMYWGYGCTLWGSFYCKTSCMYPFHFGLSLWYSSWYVFFQVHSSLCSSLQILMLQVSICWSRILKKDCNSFFDLACAICIGWAALNILIWFPQKGCLCIQNGICLCHI